VLQPIVSVFGERLFVDHGLNQAKNGGFASLMAGVAIHGAGGELIPYLTLEGGNGKGLLINRREVNVTIGVRFAPF